MNIHEYQAKDLLKKYDIPLQNGLVARSVDEALQAAHTLNGPYVVKAQIHAGGRGHGGGIKFAKTPEDVASLTNNLLGKPLITPQTGPSGKVVHAVYVVEAANFDQEMYVSFVVNREQGCISLMVSRAGGVDIENAAEQEEGVMLTLDLPPLYGLKPFHIQRAFGFLNLKPELSKSFHTLLNALYKAFVEKDMQILEINPLVITHSQELLVIDAKLAFDDNALFKQPDIAALKDPLEYAPQEIKAQAQGLSYVQLEGHIGCMVNGAGLAMATMDGIAFEGGKAANFLDVGGSASKEQILAALDIILREENVTAVLVNIFGGIMKCDLIAESLIAALKELPLQKPLVVRLAGTNVSEAKELLASSNLPITPTDTLLEACREAVMASQSQALHKKDATPENNDSPPPLTPPL